MTIIAARTSNGKSAFSNQIVMDCILSGNKVLYLSLEMPVSRIIERMFCYTEKIDNYDLLRGEFQRSTVYQEKWKVFQKYLKSRKLIICDYIGKTWKEIDDTVTKFNDKPDIVIVDHVHHIRSNGNNEKQTIDEYLEHFREMTIRNHFVGIICAQVNRTSQEEKEGEPQLHHLKATGKLEEIADVVLLLHWPYHSNQNSKKGMSYFKLNVAKNRYGCPGMLELGFKPQYYEFSDYMKTETQKSNWED